MGDVTLAVLIVVVFIACVLLTICHYFDLVPWLKAWVISNREEKIGLTLLRGHYHPNGYLVHSDSDVQLGTSGSFKRFDAIDRDYTIAAATYSGYSATNGGATICSGLINGGVTGVGGSAGYYNQAHHHQLMGEYDSDVGNSSGSVAGTGGGSIDMEPGAYYEIPPQPLRPAPSPHSMMTAGSPPPSSSSVDGIGGGGGRNVFHFDGVADTVDSIYERPAHAALSGTIINTESSRLVSTGAPPTHPPTQAGQEPVSTSIRPIPRPVSSVNMSALLQQQNPQSSFIPFISPPPTQSLGAAHQQQLHNATQQYDQRQLSSSPSSASSSTTLTEEQDVTSLMSSAQLKRAVSCESVCSDTSVALENLEASNITGYLCLSLEYDSENQEMVANVLEAKDLCPPATIGDPDRQMDTYIRIFLLPDKAANIQTKIIKGSNSPSYKERVLFTLHPRDQNQRSLCFHVYSVDSLSHSLIGEGELRLADVSLRQPVTTWVTLTDTGQRGTEFGEIMFSLSYLPTAERLTVVVVKARNLRISGDKEMGDPFIKVYLLQNGKKIHKKKTSTKKSERCPIFNEAMMFSVPAHNLQTIQLRLTVAEASHVENVKAYAIGHVIVGAQATGRSLNHWNQMLAALRKPVAMWHTLRK